MGSQDYNPARNQEKLGNQIPSGSCTIIKAPSLAPTPLVASCWLLTAVILGVTDKGCLFLLYICTFNFLAMATRKTPTFCFFALFPQYSKSCTVASNSPSLGHMLMPSVENRRAVLCDFHSGREVEPSLVHTLDSLRWEEQMLRGPAPLFPEKSYYGF